MRNNIPLTLSQILSQILFLSFIIAEKRKGMKIAIHQT